MDSRISIITINLNNVQKLENTLKSVCNQQYKPFEYIVIDGGSTDGSKEIIEKYGDQITSWVSEPDKGIYNAMNKGIAFATGTYLLFINSGDELYGDIAIQQCINLLEGSDLITCNLLLVSGDSQTVKTYPENPTFKYFLSDSLPHPATFIKKSMLQKAGGYNEHLKICSDWEFFLIALFKLNATHKHLPITLSKFHLDGISTSIDGRALIVEERKHVLTQQFKGFLDLIEEWKLNRYLREELWNSRIMRYAHKLGFFRFMK